MMFARKQTARKRDRGQPIQILTPSFGPCSFRGTTLLILAASSPILPATLAPHCCRSKRRARAGRSSPRRSPGAGKKTIAHSSTAGAAAEYGPAQRAVIEAVQAIEPEIETQVAANDAARTKMPAMSDLEIGRRLAFVLE